MKNYRELWEQLTPLYDETEAKAVVRTVLEVRFGLTLTDILCGKVNDLSAEEGRSLEKIMQRLRQAEPVQYVLGEAEFAGRRFKVAPGVLIPRPETEELCAWIVNEQTPTEGQSITILDIGTGSGCLAVTLSLDIPNTTVSAWDISQDALRIASENAKAWKAPVSLALQDALAAPKDSMKWDIIVSNPPYICPSEAAEMAKNVLKFEPSTALFVPQSDPLLFYKAIANYAIQALKPGGKLYIEINPLYRSQLEEMLKNVGFIDVEIRKDAFGKDRMARATRPCQTEKS
ncbi:peptide chain release factor N(5)-glutamine methyltransferase [Hoylesella buccalis]|uniref:peptide chain release factor N(5)-glutamine methyltransferase n=1 Tax=Hoylesella buccalis TaxID=28127 RepID=UPI001D13C7D0|nr:peptide chain release factor N(5)-glutamine methyltransferase [Hoylesella buccalis]UEA63672.1 peptide chain release factor N(5)-glutamine methyltransferase [Hoylesella buccalis]UWP49036.1 peptide chain release factor N(5)-glutamine methyltransferase [Hoylesella buccalis ATCC 35310]